MHGGNRSGSGRKPVPIDLELLEKLCMLHPTEEELAAVLGVSTRTLESRRKQRQFAEVMSRGRAKGRLSVRRAQLKLLEAGNATMAIWLGKQLLGQRDVTPVELSGPQGEPVRLSIADLDAFLDEAHHQAADRPARNRGPKEPN